MHLLWCFIQTLLLVIRGSALLKGHNHFPKLCCNIITAIKEGNVKILVMKD